MLSSLVQAYIFLSLFSFTSVSAFQEHDSPSRSSHISHTLRPEVNILKTGDICSSGLNLLTFQRWMSLFFFFFHGAMAGFNSSVNMHNNLLEYLIRFTKIPVSTRRFFTRITSEVFVCVPASKFFPLRRNESFSVRLKNLATCTIGFKNRKNGAVFLSP